MGRFEALQIAVLTKRGPKGALLHDFLVLLQELLLVVELLEYLVDAGPVNLVEIVGLRLNVLCQQQLELAVAALLEALDTGAVVLSDRLFLQ